MAKGQSNAEGEYWAKYHSGWVEEYDDWTANTHRSFHFLFHILFFFFFFFSFSLSHTCTHSCYPFSLSVLANSSFSSSSSFFLPLHPLCLTNSKDTGALSPLIFFLFFFLSLESGATLSLPLTPFPLFLLLLLWHVPVSCICSFVTFSSPITSFPPLSKIIDDADDDDSAGHRPHITPSTNCCDKYKL
ncbi:unnamed protein product [Acanthosepion pharaonis]|uniref:Uncharacterized protein n=1 Tax=Acanthosepion pharaonis TaxID=158019 RepID=A0A812D2X1_ACAPH|nr:unnamed protein product [Sepia pharaonis]